MPLEPSDFPVEVQVAFFIFGMLSDVWEGMSGSYLGKNWSSLSSLLEIYEVDEQKAVVYFIKMYENIVVDNRAKEAEQRRKAEERKASAGGGKKYTHNVRG